jgi:hypothetical protein
MTRLKDLDDGALECRALRGHAWEPISNHPGEVPSKQVFSRSTNTGRLMFQCERCATIKIVVWSRYSGEVLSTQYRYSREYELADPDERPTAIARVAYMKRLEAADRLTRSRVVPIRRRRSA